MAIYTLTVSQKIPVSVEQIWDFISSPKNLKKITPDYMGFEVTTENLPEKMYPGMIISYKVSPFPGMKLTWVTEISQVRELEFFVDEQRIGPYNFWHHQHHVKAIDGGTLMSDIVHYAPPYGFLGRIANSLLIRKQLMEIFNFRRNRIEEIYGVFRG